MLEAAAAELAQAGASGMALEWVQVFAPGALLGVALGSYLTARARYAALNEQHVPARVEAARDSYLAAYRIANRLRLDVGQEVADLWKPELAHQIDDLVWQVYDHEFMLEGRQAKSVAAAFREARTVIHEITQVAGNRIAHPQPSGRSGTGRH